MTTPGLDHEALFEAVRSCDLRQVLEARGYAFQPGRDGFLRENPTRSERTASIRVRTDQPSRWKDFGSGAGGDLIDFLEAAEGLDREEARRAAAAILGVASRTRGGTRQNVNTAKSNGEATSAQPPRDLEATSTQPDEVEGLDELVDQAHAALLRDETEHAERARAYLRARGLDPDGATIRAAKVGVVDPTVDLPESMKRFTFDGRLVFPYRDRAGRVVFLNARASGDVDQAARFRKPAGLEQPGPYRLEALHGRDHAILVEGELDALAVMDVLGVDTPVLATGGGGLSPKHVALLRDLDLVFLLFDRDERGEAFTRGAQSALKTLDVRTEALGLPDGAKDASEALVLSRAALKSSLEAEIDAAMKPGDYSYLRTTFLKELDRRHERPWPAYPTGLAPLDALLDGGFHEGLHVLGGLTGGGKTSFALRLALSNAMEGRDVIYASFEQSRHELWSRLASAATALPYSALKRGTYDQADGERIPAAYLLQQKATWSRLLEASEHLHVLEAGDALSRKDGAYSVEGLHKLAEKRKLETGVPPLVVIDYLQRVPAKDLAGRDIRERVGHVAGLLQVGLAREIGCPVLALSSMNRASYATSGAKATPEQRLASLKESGEVEYSAYTVSLLYHYRDGEEPAGFVPGASDKWRPVGCSLAKNREGRTGDATLLWEPVGDKWSAAPKKEVRW